jgi:hypothetical protein
MLSGVSFIIFAIIFGILVDRFDHINVQIDTVVNFGYLGSYPKIGLDGLYGADFTSGQYLIDEKITRKCVYLCYSKSTILENYMKPDEDIYKDIFDKTQQNVYPNNFQGM